MLLMCRHCKMVFKSWAMQCPKCGGRLKELSEPPVRKGGEVRTCEN